MLQFNFIAERPQALMDLGIFACSMIVSLILFFQALLISEKPSQQQPLPTKVFVQTQWIEEVFFKHLWYLIKKIDSPQVFIKKLVIHPKFIILSGMVENQQAFYVFWQALKADKKVTNVDLLHWYGQNQAFCFDLRVGLKCVY
jgi:hypothetical protein